MKDLLMCSIVSVSCNLQKFNDILMNCVYGNNLKKFFSAWITQTTEKVKKRKPIIIY